MIDPISPRYTALLANEAVPFLLPGATEETKLCPRHPKNADVGQKEVHYSSRVLIEGADAQTLHEGETVTLINWGNVVVTKLSRSVSSREVQLYSGSILRQLPSSF